MIGIDNREGLATEAVAVGLVDTEAAVVMAGNRAYAELVSEDVVSLAGLRVEAYLDPPRAAVARTLLASMRAGWIDYLEGAVELRGRNGPHAYSWSQALGAHPPRELMISGALPAELGMDRHEVFTPPVDPDRVVLATLDDDWRFRDLAVSSAALLGGPRPVERDTEFSTIVHPADAAALSTFRDQSEPELGPATAELRLRGRDESWLNARVTVSRLYGRASAHLVVVIALPGAGVAAESGTDRANRLEANLARIAAEVRAAGVDLPDSEVRFDPTDLTPRENEILRRLVLGERVPKIARELFISPSTVRNNLSAIFRKFGVHSQGDLIEVLRRPPET